MNFRTFSLTLLTILASSGCRSESKPTTDSVAKPLDTLQAKTLTIQYTPWPQIIRSQGSLFADEQSIVGAEVAGQVAEVHGDVGDRMQMGDPLVTLDQENFRLQVQIAEAQLLQTRSSVGLLEGDPIEKLDPANAPPVRQERALWEETKSSMERFTSLRTQNAISQGEYDVAVAAERVAEARYASAVNGVREKIALIKVRQGELDVARDRLKDAIIRAPMDGFVLNRQVAPGTFLSVGQPVATIVRTHPLRFRGTVPERVSQSIVVGQSVRLTIESLPEPRETTITRVSPALDRQSRALMFEALIGNKDFMLRAGLFAEASVVTDPDAQALIVPESAITEFAGATKAWVVVDGVTAEREVRIGSRRDAYLEVVQGLSPGDVILQDAEQGRIANVEIADSSPTDVSSVATPVSVK